MTKAKQKNAPHKKWKLHTWYTVILGVISLIILLIAPNISLFVVLGMLLLYVGGNGIIHVRSKTISRDALLEYGLVALVAFFVLIGAVLNSV